MALDPLSPVAPARVRALLLPVGRIKRSRFTAFVERLQPEYIVRLGDVSPDPRPNRTMFSPLAFPNGVLLYELSTSLPPPSHVSLSPFELYREPLVIIGIADAKEYPWLTSSDSAGTDGSRDEEKRPAEGESDLRGAVDDLREQYSKALVHSLLLFDRLVSTPHPWLPEETVSIPPKAQVKTTTMKTVMCDLTAVLLAEMTSLAKSLQALPSIASPSLSQGTINAEDWQGIGTRPPALSRRNSQLSGTPRSASPATSVHNNPYRMSMPAQLPSSSSSPNPGGEPRPTSPPSGAQTPPATTFDEMPGITSSADLFRADSAASKPSAASIARDASRDRVSVHGFGSGSVSERARNKGKGRVGMVIGTLYMCAGRWYDALRELTESATRARAASDHLWHAKCLEHILVCLLLFAWAGIDFQIPQICYPIADKPTSVKSPQHTPSSSITDVSAITSPATSNHAVALQNLNALLPDLANMILSVYVRAANFSGEAVPQLSFSECIIRFSKLLTAMNLSGGVLDDDALQHLVRGTPLNSRESLSISRISINPTRNDIAGLIFRALPAASEATSLSPIDRLMILAAMASVLGSLGLERKKAMVMKEFISSLIPGLVQARKVGAAEMGVHPAAGLTALNLASGGATGAGALNLGEGEVESGINELLTLLGQVYGIPDARNAVGPKITSLLEINGSNHQLRLETLLKHSTMRSFGSLYLKLDILRICIHFCEALPDFQGVLDFTATLLRIAGPGSAPSPNSTGVFVYLSREEQLRLATNISRTVSAARSLGLQNVETDYWDDFLVRGIRIIDPPLPRRLIKHRKAELYDEGADEQKQKSPFIHDPFLKSPEVDPVANLIVAAEMYEFIVALQNPYDFEVEIELLKLAAEQVEFTSELHNLVLGPYRTQKFSLDGIAHSPGVLQITGCIVRIKGCRERVFPIFSDSWSPEVEVKMKAIGLKASLGQPASRPVSAQSTFSLNKQSSSSLYPIPASLPLTVVPEQPLVVVSNVSLPQSALMVLEGERKRFFVTLRNVSKTTSVDFLHISFRDSSTSALEAAMTNKDISQAELYELEVQLAHNPAFRWIQPDDESASTINPGEEATFEIEMIGKPGLTEAIIRFDYANLGMPKSEVKDQFFTRQVSVSISATVNAGIQLHRVDLVPFTGDFAWANQQKRGPVSDGTASGDIIHGPLTKGDDCFRPLLDRIGLGADGSEHCMLLLDVRNAWPSPLSISLNVQDVPMKEDKWSEESGRRAYTIHEVIQPGHTSRLVLLLPKLYLKDAHVPIPSLNPANQRQFVVSTSKISPESERASREAFWYREELLKRIHGSWKEEGSGREGDIDLRGIRCYPRMVEAIKLDDVAISMAVINQSEEAALINQTGRARFEIAVDEFLTLRTRLHNRSQKPIYPLLRLQPSLADLPYNVALDLDKKFSWSGLLQRALEILHPGQTVEVDLGICALCSGVFEIGATVEELQTWKDATGDSGGNRPRSNTGLLRDSLLGETGKRTWHAKEACTIVATQL